jgi:hypothetical protein
MLGNNISLLPILVIFTFLGSALAKTTEEISRDIAIAGVVIAGVTFLMICFICLASDGLARFHSARNGHTERRENTNTANPMEVRLTGPPL